VCFTDRNLTGEIVLGAHRGGIAVIDYDNDGLMDLFIGNSAGTPNRLFRNVPDPNRSGFRTFVDVTTAAGLNDAEGTAGDGFGAVVADYDNDGDSDLYVLGRAVIPGGYGNLYRNNGNGTFTNVSVAAGVRRTGAPESVSWTDYDLDGYPDLMAVRLSSPYLELLRNNRNGTFTAVNGLLPSIPGFTHCYSHMWMDYDRDGYADCFLISNTGAGTEVLLHNVSDGAGGRRFVNVAQELGYTNHGPAPMGIVAGDFDGDLDLDLGISDAANGTYYENVDGTFQQIFPFGTMFGWGVSWIDIENDGDLDFYTAGSWGANNFNNLQRNDGGSWTNVSAVLNGDSRASQHNVQIDLNNDGRQDLITVNPLNSISIYENISTTGNHWIKLRLVGDGTTMSRDALGALVYVTAGGSTQVTEIASGSSTTSTEDLRQHFGLGSTTTVDSIVVVWPRRGTVESRTDVFTGPFAADQILTLSPLPPSCPGDANGDGNVENQDLQIVLDAWATALPAPAYDPRADLDRDGQVSNGDLQVLLKNWQSGCE
jgi:hypothetical protein